MDSTPSAGRLDTARSETIAGSTPRAAEGASSLPTELNQRDWYARVLAAIEEALPNVPRAGL